VNARDLIVTDVRHLNRL